MADAVSPSSQAPEWDVTLSDGTTTVGFILKNTRGEPDPQAIQRTPVSRTAIKTSTGDSKYEDFELPYMGIEQRDWSGGRGQLNFEDDTTKFADSSRAMTWHDGMVLAGGQVRYSKGYRSSDMLEPTGNMNIASLTAAVPFYASQFTASASYTSWYVEVWLKANGSPNDVKVALRADSTNLPGAIIDSMTVAAATITSDNLFVCYSFALGANNLTATTKYWISVEDSGTPTTANFWQVIRAACTGAYSANGSSWTAQTSGPCFRITDANTSGTGILFEYKRAMYHLSVPTSGAASTLYLNGDRGAADSNSGDKTYLNDASKTWTTNEWVGCKVLLIAGPGSEEETPWRDIIGNSATALEVLTDWNIAHTTDTEYVILGSNKWTSDWNGTDTPITLTKPVTDVAIAGEMVFLARGFNAAVLKYREWNDNGTWTVSSSVTSIYAQHLLAIPSTDGGYKLWVTTREYDEPTTYVEAQNIQMFSVSQDNTINPYADLGLVAPTDIPWDDWTIANVTNVQSIGNTYITVTNTFTTGVIAVKNLDEAVDLTRGNAFLMSIRSSEAYADNELKLVYDDVIDIGKQWSPTALKQWDYTAATAPTYKDLPASMDGTTYTATTFTGSTTQPKAWTTVNGVMACHTEPFGKIIATVSSGNAVDSVLSVWYWNGQAWATVSNLADGTTGTAGNAGKTFFETGDITWTIPYNWEPNIVDEVQGYWVLLTVSVNLTDPLTVTEIAVERRNNIYTGITALSALRWHDKMIGTIDFTRFPYPDESAIKSVGLYINVDQGATHTIRLDNGLRLISTSKAELHIPLPQSTRVNRIVEYKNSNGVSVPWFITDSTIFFIDTENNNNLTPVPLGEIKAFTDESNGLAACVNDVYMYFNLGHKLERYFDRTMEDIGPDRGEGLPDNRKGTPSCMVSLPGKILMGMDGDDGYSSVMLSPGNENWHEVYRSGITGRRIRSIAYQDIPGQDTGRIWISEGQDILHVLYTTHPKTDIDFRYHFESALETSWINTNLYSMQKVWDSLRMILTYTPGGYLDGKQYVTAYYKVDSDTNWTAITPSYYLSESERNISSATPPNVKGKRIKFRLVITTLYDVDTAVIIATITDCFGVIPIKYSYSFTTTLEEGFGLVKDLQGDDVSTLGQYSNVETALAALDSWASNATPLTMNSQYSVMDSKTVILDAIPLMPVVKPDAYNQVERHIISVASNEL